MEGLGRGGLVGRVVIGVVVVVEGRSCRSIVDNKVDRK